MVDRVMSMRARDLGEIKEIKSHLLVSPAQEWRMVSPEYLAGVLYDLRQAALDLDRRVFQMESRAATGSCSVLSATDDWACC